MKKQTNEGKVTCCCEKEAKKIMMAEGINLKSLEPINGTYGFSQLSKMSDMGSITKISKQIFDGLVKKLKSSGADVFIDDQDKMYTVFSYGDNYNLVKLKENVKESFSKEQLKQLETGYSDIKKIYPSSPTYKKLTDMLDKLGPAELKQLSNAKIKFVSMLARNRYQRIKKESVNESSKEFDIADKIYFRSGGKEIKFYDGLEKLHQQMGHPKYMLWLSAALKGQGINMYNNPKIKNPQEAEEFLYNILNSKQ